MVIDYLQHVPFEDLGSIADWAKAKEYPTQATRPYAGEPLPDPEGVDALVKLSGEIATGEIPSVVTLAGASAAPSQASAANPEKAPTAWSCRGRPAASGVASPTPPV